MHRMFARLLAATDACFTASNNRYKRHAQTVAEVAPSKSDKNFQSHDTRDARGRTQRGESGELVEGSKYVRVQRGLRVGLVITFSLLFFCDGDGAHSK